MAATLFLLALFLTSILPIFFHLVTKRGRGAGPSQPQRFPLPPGSMGLPIVGQSLALIRAMKTNTAEKWLEDRTIKYGHVSKLSLFGTPTIFLAGPAANKFIFASGSLRPKLALSMKRIIGERNIRELNGDDHRRIRGATDRFLGPDMLKQYVGRMDCKVRLHLNNNWMDQLSVTVLPLMKRLTFDVLCSTMFGLEDECLRDRLSNDLVEMQDGMWSVPVNLPFTSFNKSMRASRRARDIIAKIMGETRTALEKGSGTCNDDFIAYLLGSGSEDKASAVSEEETIDNAILVMTAGHDTTAVLLTFMIRQLAIDPIVYAAVAHEQEEIASGKALGEALTWDDLVKMKYTWSVAMETLRMIPPVFGNLRRVHKDAVFEGYHIPQGWQVLWTMHSTQMDATIFKEPHKFDPSRFENKSSIPPYCFAAFGGGPRVCPGSEFVKIETLVVMHYLVTEFKWKLCFKDDDAFSRYPLPTPSQGLPILLEPKGRLSKMCLG